MRERERNLREVMKSRSITDVLITVDPGELERHTLACPAQIMREAPSANRGAVKKPFGDEKKGERE